MRNPTLRWSKAPPEVRFWRFVEPMLDDRGCWEWTGGMSHNGYGHFPKIWNGSPVRAHRYAYELLVGPIPDGQLVLHRCDNPGCVNPTHLWLGTYSDNARDAFKKGRRVSPFRDRPRFNSPRNEKGQFV